MDQLRTILAWLKQQHFWVLTALVALIGLGSWWSAAGTLSAQFEANKSKITAEFNNLSSLQSNPFHPNQTIIEKQAAQNEELAKSVNVVWQRLYDRQREHVLEWPAALSQAFHDHVEKLQFGADIPPHLRQNYQDYVERHFPDLPKKIGARALREGELSPYGGSSEMMMSRGVFRGEGGPAIPVAGEEEEEGDYIVEWLDQAHVREELNFPQTPSPLRIWWTQENLWVYHTLLDVIRNTNEAAGATRMSNAAVRTIYSLEVGRPAAQVSRTKDRIYKVQVAAAPMGEEMRGPEMGGEAGGEGRELGPEMPFQSGGFGDSRTPTTPEQEAAYLLSHRYLGEDGKPITTLVNLACHPEGLEKGIVELSADFPGYLCEQVRRDGGGQPVFLNGALGGMVSGDSAARTHAETEKMGLAFAAHVKELAETAQPPAKFEFSAETRRVEIPMTNEKFRPLYETMRPLHDGRVVTEMTLFTLGECQMVTLPGEVLPEISFEIQEKMTGFPRMLIGLANDQLGYIIPAYDFREKSYEESMSQGPATGLIVRDTAHLMLAGLE